MNRNNIIILTSGHSQTLLFGPRNSKMKTSRPTRIIILGIGFVGVEVMKRLQKGFHNDDSIVITMISRDNFFLFTPMLPEVATDAVETRRVVASVRSFCKTYLAYEHG